VTDPVNNADCSKNVVDAVGNPVQLLRLPLIGVPSAGATRVLLVSVSVVALPTSVSVATGRVNVLLPAVAGAANVILPEISPAMTTLDIICSPLDDCL